MLAKDPTERRGHSVLQCLEFLVSSDVCLVGLGAFRGIELDIFVRQVADFELLAFLYTPAPQGLKRSAVGGPLITRRVTTSVSKISAMIWRHVFDRAPPPVARI